MTQRILGYPKTRDYEVADVLGHYPRRRLAVRPYPIDADRVTTHRGFFYVDGTVVAINLPEGCEEGDLLIAMLSSGSGTSSHALAGFTELIAYAAGGTSGSSLWYRICDGREGLTAELTLGVQSVVAAVVHRIIGAAKRAPLAIRSSTNTVPLNLAVGRGQVPALYLSYLAHIIVPDSSVPPSGMTKGVTIGGNPSASGASLQLMEPSYTPNSMTSSSVNGRSYTVAVAPRGVPI